MSARGASIIAVALWLVWTCWVITHYFAVPGTLVLPLDGPVFPATHWRDSLVRELTGVGGAALVVASAWIAGAIILSADRSRFLASIERLLFRLAAGFAALAWLFLGLAVLHVYRPPVVAGLLTIGTCLGFAVWFSPILTRLSPGARARNRESRTPSPEPRARSRASLRDWVFLVCAGAAITCALVGALAPETEYDALWYHLWLPRRWLEAGHPVDLIEEYVSLYPLSWELLNGAAIAAGGPIAAKLLHFVCLLLLGVTSYLLSLRLFPHASASLAAALTIVTPIVIWEGSTAYIDLALAWYCAMSLYALAEYDRTNDRRWLLLGALTTGMAAAIKHLGLVVFAIVIGWLTIREVRSTRRFGRALRTSALFAIIALLFPSPWYARAYAASGNPVFPDLYWAFGARPPERWQQVSERGLQAFKARFGRERTMRNMALLPWDMTVHGARYGGTLGPIFLILVPSALLRRRPRTAALVVAGGCASYLAVWASPLSSFQMRFVVPLVPLLAVVAAEGAAGLSRAANTAVPGGGQAVSIVVASLLVFNLPPLTEWHERDRVGWNGWMTHIMRALPARVVAGAESEPEYLARTVPSFRAWQFINSTLAPTDRVLTFSGGDHLYSTRPRIWSDATAAREVTWGAPAGHEPQALDVARRLGVTHVLFDKRQVADGTVSALAIGSGRMHACCLARLYEDERFALYELRQPVNK
jgi:4-amino-4-deoxy-L-arabinose transferase-like glycosyltransferase